MIDEIKLIKSLLNLPVYDCDRGGNYIDLRDAINAVIDMVESSNVKQLDLSPEEIKHIIKTCQKERGDRLYLYPSSNYYNIPTTEE